MQLIDTHCHLDFDTFDPDREAVMQRASEAGIGVVLNPSVDLENTAKVLTLADQFDSLFAAVGIHPNDSSTWTNESEAMLKELAQHPKVVAIGEIGLDYYRDRAPKDVQRKVFRQQLEAAGELELPVIVHNREASEDVLEMLLAWQGKLMEAGSPLAERPGVLHSFSGNLDMAQKAIAANFFIGFTGPVTFRNAAELQQIAAELPIENMLIETDSPFLSPHPQRGQRNEPANVKLIAGKLAELKGISVENVCAATTANARRLFNFGKMQ